MTLLLHFSHAGLLRCFCFSLVDYVNSPAAV